MGSKRTTNSKYAYVAWGIWTLVLLFGLVAMVLFALNRNTVVGASWGTPGGVRNDLAQWLNVVMQSLVSPAIAAGLGALIISRQPGHRIGWLLLLIGVAFSLIALFGEYAVYGAITITPPLPGAAIAAWIGNWIWVVAYALLVLTLAIFPNGRFLSRGWMVAVGVPWLFFTVPMLLASAIEQPMSSAYSLPNPFVARHLQTLYDSLFVVGVPMMPLMVTMVFAQVVARYRAAGPVERRQIKWLLAGVAGLAVMVVAGVGLIATFGLASTLGAILVNTAVILPLAAIGVAILRDRLYDIDVIIRKTLIYGLSTGVLALVYFASVTLLTGLFSSATGQQSPLAIVVSTLVIAAIFTPLRTRIQDTIDQRFYRKKYDARQVLARFAITARDETDMNALTAELARVVQETMQPETTAVWLRSTKRPKGG